MANHPDTTTLLDYLDGSCPADDSAHIQHCNHCLNELEQICATRANLKQLPLQQPPEYLWRNIQAQTRPRTSYYGKFGWLAAAASVLLVVGLLLPSLYTNDEVVNLEFANLLEESHQLESALAYFDRRPAVVKLGTAGKIGRYKDSIAAIDLAMNEQSRSDSNTAVRNTLMKERIRLMRSLVEEQAQPMLASYQAF